MLRAAAVRSKINLSLLLSVMSLAWVELAAVKRMIRSRMSFDCSSFSREKKSHYSPYNGYPQDDGYNDCKEDSKNKGQLEDQEKEGE